MILAYIDPVSATFIVQILIAGIVASIAFFRRRIFGPFLRLHQVVFRRKSKAPSEEE